MIAGDFAAITIMVAAQLRNCPVQDSSPDRNGLCEGVLQDQVYNAFDIVAVLIAFKVARRSQQQRLVGLTGKVFPLRVASTMTQPLFDAAVSATCILSLVVLKAQLPLCPSVDLK